MTSIDVQLDSKINNESVLLNYLCPGTIVKVDILPISQYFEANLAKIQRSQFYYFVKISSLKFFQ